MKFQGGSSFSAQYDDFVATGKAATLSPIELQGRLLLKGKIRRSSCSGGGTKSAIWRKGGIGTGRTSFGAGRNSDSPRTPPNGFTRGSSSLSFVQESCHSIEGRQARVRTRRTDEFYGACLSLRSLPVDAFLQGNRGSLPLPITSINEDILLKELGLTDDQRHQIEGVLTIKVRGALGMTEEQLSNRAVARLAADPPPPAGAMQRLTTSWLLRPFPLGMPLGGSNRRRHGSVRRCSLRARSLSSIPNAA